MIGLTRAWSFSPFRGAQCSRRFFGLSVLALSRAAKISPQAMMLAGMGTYIFKILVLLFLVGRFQNSTAFSPWLFGLTAIVLVLVYDAALAITFSRTNRSWLWPGTKSNLA